MPTFDVARFVLEILILVIGIGYWAGEISSRRQRLHDPGPSAAPRGDIEQLTRSVKRLEERVDHAARKSSETESKVMTKIMAMEFELARLKGYLNGLQENV